MVLVRTVVNWCALFPYYRLKRFQVLTEEQHILAAKNEYNFDHPQAFDFDLLIETVRRLREGKSVEVDYPSMILFWGRGI